MMLKVKLGSSKVLQLCFVPLMTFFMAFWLLPMAKLLALPAEKGFETYFAVLIERNYLLSLLNTLGLSILVTFTTLLLGAAVGIHIVRTNFWGKKLLISFLTLPLCFPGVIIGFFIILLGGRQGVVVSFLETAGLGTWTFAYSFMGLFLGYLYFSLPRAISAYYAAAQSLNISQEEAARSLGASHWQVIRDVWIPELEPVTIACGAIVFATAMGAFGTAFTLASKYEVLPITIYNEFTNYGNFAIAAALSIALGLVTSLTLFLMRRFSGNDHLKSFGINKIN